MQARIKRQGDWALKCTSGHDLERQFIDTINDSFFEQLVLVPMWEDVTPDLGLCSAVLTLQVGLLGHPSRQRRAGAGLPRAHALTRHGACPCAVPVPMPSKVCGAHTLDSIKGSIPPALVPHAGAGASQRQPHGFAALHLSSPSSMRLCGPCSDLAKAVKPLGRVTPAPRNKLFFAGVKCERQGRKASFTALS